ncbi:ABC-type amino acid transport/signal transduction systems, periplasmic component/domain protein [Legionella oakridgensis ATCC 33761 = DSM 21215]|uniref:ABC-type amino acid transport/signal transduction systems, periplasmic component/domain protein n=1 Tax=Legionella oakridgensis ATCC 33761 = DSM 21215 TaxID=1268635 RepID=W0BE11_9GAMM|nr:ABC-type amino acid transport/signal transduction systems, periplasmic component/domain protein [Legionella oakridgensis ATCC 33761 = DSM 21215]
MKKSFYVILIFFTNCLAANATIKIGTPIYDPPYAVYGKISGVSGADINLMNIICNRLGWDCEYVPMKYDQLLSALDENKIDFAIGALIIPEEKQNKYIYTLPYMISQAGFLTMTTSPIHSIKSCKISV